MFSIYDHRSNVSFVSSSSFALNSFLLDEANYGSLAEKLEKHPAIKTLEFPRDDDGAFIDGTLNDGVLHFELGDDMEGDLLDVALVRRTRTGVRNGAMDAASGRHFLRDAPSRAPTIWAPIGSSTPGPTLSVMW